MYDDEKYFSRKDIDFLYKEVGVQNLHAYGCLLACISILDQLGFVKFFSEFFGVTSMIQDIHKTKTICINNDLLSINIDKLCEYLTNNWKLPFPDKYTKFQLVRFKMGANKSHYSIFYYANNLNNEGKEIILGPYIISYNVDPKILMNMGVYPEIIWEYNVYETNKFYG